MTRDLLGFNVVPTGTDAPDGSDGHNHSYVELTASFSERIKNNPISSLIN